MVSIQAMLIPQMKVLKHEISIAENLMSRDANISFEEGFFDLETSLEIQIHILEVTKSN